MKANTLAAIAEFRKALDKKKITEEPPPKKRRWVLRPEEDGEQAADVAIEAFKKEIKKIK